MFYDVYLALCEQHGVSVSKMAESVGLNRSAVVKWKKGAIPNGPTLQKLAEKFGVSTDYLLGAETEKAPTQEGRRKLDPEDMKAAFWGGDEDLSPEDLEAMWADVKNFADFLARKTKEEKRK